MTWIFKLGNNFHFEDDGKRAIVALTQKRTFSGQEGDDVLLLQKKNSDWVFTDHYLITSIETENEDLENKRITISLSLKQHFDEIKALADYNFSLKRIRNFKYPIKHFSNKYSRLSDVEFDAIVNDKIYVKRTILGTVLNAMHSDHQRSFIGLVAMEAPEFLSGEADIDKALDLILEYLEFAIVKPSQYLREGAQILSTIVIDGDIGRIGFGNSLESEERILQMIQPQVAIINEYSEILSEYAIQNLKVQLVETPETPKFKDLFRNSPLPIILKQD